MEIKLKSGKTALIDSNDYERLSAHEWTELAGYAATSINNRTVYMHRFLLDAVESFEVDHINNNRLDNRKSNLRLCTSAQNRYNQSRRKDNTSGIKGVSWDSVNKKWRAKLKFEGRHMCLGRYRSLEEAASAYAHAANKYFGEFANLG